MSSTAGPADSSEARTVGDLALRLIRERSLSCQELAAAARGYAALVQQFSHGGLNGDG
jgi:hypothetical protein